MCHVDRLGGGWIRAGGPKWTRPHWQLGSGHHGPGRSLAVRSTRNGSMAAAVLRAPGGRHPASCTARRTQGRCAGRRAALAACRRRVPIVSGSTGCQNAAYNRSCSLSEVAVRLFTLAHPCRICATAACATYRGSRLPGSVQSMHQDQSRTRSTAAVCPRPTHRQSAAVSGRQAA